ncbi:MAG: aminotransferase class V-fold PLP-dependent enzyme [Oscillospiraceae bacterium]|nr:aminotransferase class V-fold PLP-dependent enzyme [Oscillospiraceae bacterium]
MAIQLFMPAFQIEECLAEIRECLEKGWTGLGYKTIEFEEAWKDYSGHENAHFLSSATAGLHQAVKILKRQYNWRDGDEIITTPITFVSSNHAILYENMVARFADVDQYLCLDPHSVKSRINEKTRAVLFVGYGGSFGQLNEIIEICREYGLKLILDAAHMAGSRVKGKFPGVFDGIDVTVYSFQAVKNLPTADSGMICFKDPEMDAVCRKMTWMGINKDTYARFNKAGNYKWNYDVEFVGYKHHGNSIMAAIGLVQLKYLERDNAYRRQICNWYDDFFAGNDDVKPIPVTYRADCSRHLYAICVPDRDGLIEHLNSLEIYPGVHYTDNTEYEIYAYDHGKCPHAHEVCRHILSLPLHMRLSFDDVRIISGAVNAYTTSMLTLI